MQKQMAQLGLTIPNVKKMWGMSKNTKKIAFRHKKNVKMILGWLGFCSGLFSLSRDAKIMEIIYTD